MIMKVCIYCRSAYDDGFSLEMQKKELQHYANQNGYTVVGVYAECGSGLTLKHPKLWEATDQILSGEAEMLIVKSIDRISRDWQKTQKYIDSLTKQGGRILCVNERRVFSDKSKRECPHKDSQIL